jgi:hypothetical protein
MRLELKFSSAQLEPKFSSAQLEPLLSNLMTHLTAGWVRNYDPSTHLFTFRWWINVDKKYWEGSCPSDIFLADIKNIRI